MWKTSVVENENMEGEMKVVTYVFPGSKRFIVEDKERGKFSLISSDGQAVQRDLPRSQLGSVLAKEDFLDAATFAQRCGIDGWSEENLLSVDHEENLAGAMGTFFVLYRQWEDSPDGRRHADEHLLAGNGTLGLMHPAAAFALT